MSIAENIAQVKANIARAAEAAGRDPDEILLVGATKMNDAARVREAIAAGRCTVRQGDVSALELPEESFDLATAFETVYFWPGLEKCFAQVARVLRPGGYFLICNESDGKDAAGKKYEKIIDGMRCYTSDELSEALLAAGFSEVTPDHHGANPWITVLAKK